MDIKFNISKERKIILIAGVVLLLMGVIYRYFPVFDSFTSLDDEIALKEQKLIKYRKMVQERNELEQKLIRLNRILERAESGLLTGDTPSLAAVDIQNIINKIAGNIGAEVLTMRVLKVDEKEETLYMAIPVQVTFRSRMRQLKELLYMIEDNPKLLKISDFRIRMIHGKEEGEIQATLTVEGFMKRT